MRHFQLDRSSVIKLFGICVFLFMPLFLHDGIGVPAVLNDEIGYLANGAYFSGYDWNEVLSGIPYYSYGYSILIAPLYRWISDSNFRYMFLIFLNGVFLAGSFTVTCRISDHLFPEKNRDFCMIVSFSAVFSSSALVLSQYAWAESLLYLVTALIVFLLIKIIERPTYGKIFTLAFLGIYVYLVHQRAIAIVLAIVLEVFILKMVKKIKWSHFFLFAGLCVCCLLIQSIIKEDLKSSIWSTGMLNGSNDYGGQIEKVTALFSISGIKSLMYSVFGKLYALLQSYALLPIVLFYYIWKKGCSIVKQRKCELEKLDLIVLFLIVALILAIAVNAVFFLYPDRVDQVVYTRYFDYIMPTICMLCLLLIRGNFSKKGMLWLLAVVGILALGAQRLIGEIDNQYFIGIQSPVCYLFSSNYNYYGIASIFGGIAILGIYSLYTKSRKAGCMCLAIVCCFSLYTAQTTLSGFIKSDVITQNMRKNFIDFSEKMEDVIPEQEETIYLLRGEREDYMANFFGGVLQAQSPEVHMQYIDSLAEIPNKGDNFVVVWETNAKISEAKYKMVYSNDSLSLYSVYFE